MGRSKYGAKRTEIDGIKFDSMAESRRYLELKMLEAAGEITGLSVHPRFVVWECGKDKITYVGDFQYHEAGELVVEDVKGGRNGKVLTTPVFRLKAKMFKATHPNIRFVVVER